MCCQHQAVNWRTIETINGPSLNISELILDGIGLCSRCANATQTLIQQNALNSASVPGSAHPQRLDSGRHDLKYFFSVTFSATHVWKFYPGLTPVI